MNGAEEARNSSDIPVRHRKGKKTKYERFRPYILAGKAKDAFLKTIKEGYI
jgi:hypothetical protein